MLYFKRRLKMKKQKLELIDGDEIKLLSNQVSPEEMFIIGFLKGFDRKTLKEWEDNEIIDFSIEFTADTESLSDAISAIEEIFEE